MKKFNMKSYIKTHLHEGLGDFRNQEEIDQLLDKISKFGVKGVSPADLRRLKRLTSDDPDEADVDLRPEEKPLEDRVELVAFASLGQYIPQRVVEKYLDNENWIWAGVEDEDIEAVKAGPDHPYYWEAWDNISQELEIINDNREICVLVNSDGNLWMVPLDVDDQEFQEWLSA